jgi:hypothetical protein
VSVQRDDIDLGCTWVREKQICSSVRETRVTPILTGPNLTSAVRRDGCVDATEVAVCRREQPPVYLLSATMKCCSESYRQYYALKCANNIICPPLHRFAPKHMHYVSVNGYSFSLYHLLSQAIIKRPMPSQKRSCAHFLIPTSKALIPHLPHLSSQHIDQNIFSLLLKSKSTLIHANISHHITTYPLQVKLAQPLPR